MPNTPTILAIECSGPASHIGLLHHGQFYHGYDAAEYEKPTLLLPLIETVTAAAHIRYDEIDRIIITTGPGSFTGIRIGLALALGLAAARTIPVIGITSFDAYAMATPPHEKKMIVLESKRADYYAYDCATKLAFLCAADTLHQSNKNLVGNIPRDNIKQPASDTLCRAMVDYAASLSEADITAHPAQPYYMRDADAKPAPLANG